MNIEHFNIPKGLRLADPEFITPRNIDLLIGAQFFWPLLNQGHIKLGKGLPTLNNTALGWIISGSVPTIGVERSQCYLTKTDSVQDQLQMFWEIEECPKIKPLSLEHKLCESILMNTIERDPFGKYVVAIPLKDSPETLGDSRAVAERKFFSLERKLITNPQLKNVYIKFMNEYQSLGHMTIVHHPSFNPIQYFLPHHGVVNEASKTTKLRVVFDGSCPTSNGISLNDLQLVGPTVQSDLFSILVRFRQHPIAFSADVEKMYRQVFVRPQDRNLQQILWRSDPSHPLQIFQLNTVTYGTASAPYLATRCLLQVADEYTRQFPKACAVIKTDFYVDDVLSGGNSREEVQILCNQIKTILGKIHFNLHKWVSNDPQVLPHQNISTFDHIQLGYYDTTKTLGLHWSPKNDKLNYKIHLTFNSSTLITKRFILSQISQVFDPLGLLSACTILSKILLQQVWQEKLDWDDQIPINIAQKWTHFQKELPSINNIQVPRHLICLNPKQLELHCFSDASEYAYASCVYVRSINENDYITVHLLCAKSKVAPLKRLTIPRLELCAAHLSSKLLSLIKKALHVTIHNIFMWSDSTIVLGWLKVPAHLLKVFVSHRVAEIQSSCSDALWQHVSSKDNPADLGSRGLSPSQLKNATLWWHGPKWLSQQRSEWPITQISNTNSLPELKPVETTCLIATSNFPLDYTRFSNYHRLVRSLAFCMRFKNNCLKPVHERILKNLKVDELEKAEIILVKALQLEQWSSEMSLLNANKQVLPKSSIASLNPFIDTNGVLRVGGRLTAADLNFERKHPILLPKHYITQLIFKWEHKRLGHPGPQLLLANIWCKFWPLGARNYGRLTVHICIQCFKCKPRNTHPLMGNLPADRVRISYLFEIVGVDYAGPLLIKDRNGRGCKVTKCYIAIFVCLVTKAIHIELVSSLSTDTFLAALRRFISRRGKPSKIYFDNGTTFTGANRELRDLYKFIKDHDDEFSESLSVIGITWSFIPPNSPNFGGLWEAAVKQTKIHLRRIAENSKLTFDQMTTLLTQIECILNSRPLTQLSSNPNDIEPLTPSHFLIGRHITQLPESSLLEVQSNRLLDYQKIQQMLQHFWKRWHREYLHDLQSRSKNRADISTVNVGSLIVLEDNQNPPWCWPIGRITVTFPGPDGVIRVVNVQTTRGIFKRPVSKIFPLPDNNC